MEKALVAQQVANKLFAAENSIDQAVADASLLVVELIKARKELGVSAVFGDDIIAQTTAAMSALSQARTAMVTAHRDLEDAKLRVGIRVKMAGVGDKPPSNTAQFQQDFRQVG